MCIPLLEFGAGEESRTLDLNLGKVALYQLSYSRLRSRKLYTKILLRQILQAIVKDANVARTFTLSLIITITRKTLHEVTHVCRAM